jgi:hypothetical protein
MQKFKTKIPLYGGSLEILFPDGKDAITAVEEHYNFSLEEFSAVCLHQKNSKPARYALVFRLEDFTPGLAAHEAKHLVNYIYKDNYIKLDVDNDEPECYLLSWIVNRVHEAYNKAKK